MFPFCSMKGRKRASRGRLTKLVRDNPKVFKVTTLHWLTGERPQAATFQSRIRRLGIDCLSHFHRPNHSLFVQKKFPRPISEEPPVSSCWTATTSWVSQLEIARVNRICFNLCTPQSAAADLKIVVACHAVQYTNVKTAASIRHL